MFLTQTVLPFCKYQVKELRCYRHLLTDAEKDIVEEYAHNLDGFMAEWRSDLRAFPFPKTPHGFEDILLD